MNAALVNAAPARPDARPPYQQSVEEIVAAQGSDAADAVSLEARHLNLRIRLSKINSFR